RPRIQVVLVRHHPARRADARALLAERLLQGAAPLVEGHRLLQELGQLRDERVDLGGSEEALAHRPSTKMACTSLGPCTPRVSVSSMSAVRDGPVMKLITAPDMRRAGAAWGAPTIRPTRSPDSRSWWRSNTAT